MTEAVPALSRAVELAPDQIEYLDMLVGAINSLGSTSIDNDLRRAAGRAGSDAGLVGLSPGDGLPPQRQLRRG
jgi:hypothetical protein